MVDKAKLIGALLDAPEATLQRVQDAIESKGGQPTDPLAGHHLLTIMEAQKTLGWKYGKVYRAIDEGLLDTVVALGKRHITEQSLIELSEGKRQPTAEAVRRRNERNKARREAYRHSRARK